MTTETKTKSTMLKKFAYALIVFTIGWFSNYFYANGVISENAVTPIAIPTDVVNVVVEDSTTVVTKVPEVVPEVVKSVETPIVK